MTRAPWDPRSHAWRSFVQSVGVWRLKHAALGVGPALAEDVTAKVALEALYKALDAACVVTPAAQCDIAWKDHEQHWSLAQHLQHPFVSEILNGSLCPSEVMLLRTVWWFDISSAFSLPPGIWLLRFRVKMHQNDQLRNLQVKVEVGEEEADAACDVCIQLGDHWPRSPHDVSDVDETMESIQSASPCKRLQCPVRRMVMSSKAVQHASGPIVRATGNALNTWLYVTAAVAYIPALHGRTRVRMRARLFDHSSGTLYIGWAVDALQAVPLHDPTRWPLPGKAALALEGCHL